MNRRTPRGSKASQFPPASWPRTGRTTITTAEARPAANSRSIVFRHLHGRTCCRALAVAIVHFRQDRRG